MFCHKCGTQNEEIARFCKACGTQLKSDSFTSSPYKKVVLVDCGRNKINVIKEIRMLTGASLAEAKNVSERTPSTLKDNITEDEAQQIKRIFEGIGAIIEIR